MLRITQHRKKFFVFSGLLMGLSLAAWLAWGLKPGIDFTGGSMMEIDYGASARPSAQAVAATADKALGLSDVTVQPLGTNSMVLRMPPIDETAHQKLFAELKTASASSTAVTEARFESIGPVIGDELRKMTIYAVFAAILAIVLYITYVFRKVSYPVASWKYGIATIVALCHDVIIPVGVFSALGHFRGVEVGAWMVTALLTVLGFSVHDTIVVFDRIRENLAQARREGFEDVVNRSMNETLGRSLNTSLTVLLVLLATYFLGGETIRDFILTMIIGIAAGTYSSIFVASPLLVSWQLHDSKRR